MPNGYNIARFRIPNGGPFRIAKAATKVDDLFRDEADHGHRLSVLRDEINTLQKKMFAQRQHALLVVFQAMDAAGKDSTITHVFTGVNPMGVQVSAFKRPSDEELDHDFLWRCTARLPRRGCIGVFNRSYYEPVLICKVHPRIVTEEERLPLHRKRDMEKVFAHRYESIRDYEQHLRRNGTHVIKFFLNVSKEEQARRFLARIDDESKNWKFEAADLAEREHWDQYMAAYEAAINETATDESPWFVVPADNKKNMRLIVAAALLDEMRKMKLTWPEISDEQRTAIDEGRKRLMSQTK